MSLPNPTVPPAGAPAPTGPAADSGPLQARLEFFRANSYLTLPDLLAPETVAQLNAAMDRDRAERPYFWGALNSRNGTSNLLLTEPVFEPVVRHPGVLPLVEALMGGPVCFEELSVQITPPGQEARPTAWHRDRGHWLDHPLHLDYLQIIYYLTDVDPGCHHFTLSPEPAEGEVLAAEAQVAGTHGVGDRGELHFYGKAGSAILFNAATLHGLTRAATERERRILQIYYGHEGRKPLAEVTLMPPRLWREHPDPEIRRFYGKLNQYTHDMLRWLCAGE